MTCANCDYHNFVLTYKDIHKVWNDFWRRTNPKFDKRKAKTNLVLAQADRIVELLSKCAVEKDDDIIIPKTVWYRFINEINMEKN